MDENKDRRYTRNDLKTTMTDQEFDEMLVAGVERRGFPQEAAASTGRHGKATLLSDLDRAVKASQRRTCTAAWRKASGSRVVLS